ncbi:hypothetical protein [Mesorhizobium sp.]|uniref:hypothetical protein n=1 Tax=Mesorhizobium sp. TaxID=1871066 RepID=UPI0011FA4D25|nr:hypothetical protein [Mesorhizobium sp.]TIM52950.1 MAG: hypothetical protein E5Y46_30140 [Mesorhizobium sp.]
MVMKTIGLAVCLALSVQQASARGFCNVDHYGEEEKDKEARDTVAEAAASFYSGAGRVMHMLASFERNEMEELQASVKTAEAYFRESASFYKKAADQFADHKLEDLDSEIVWAMSARPDFAGWQAVVAEANQGPATLLAGCGDKANDLAEASVRFASEVSESHRTESFSRLLRSLSAAFDYGRVVSAVFAAAGGERPQ